MYVSVSESEELTDLREISRQTIKALYTQGETWTGHCIEIWLICFSNMFVMRFPKDCPTPERAPFIPVSCKVLNGQQVAFVYILSSGFESDYLSTRNGKGQITGSSNGNWNNSLYLLTTLFFNTVIYFEASAISIKRKKFCLTVLSNGIVSSSVTMVTYCVSPPP